MPQRYRQFFLGYWNRASHSGFNFDRNFSRALCLSVLLLVLFILLATRLPGPSFSLLQFSMGLPVQ